MDQSPKIWCVVPAAGTGKRFGAAIPKQYLKLNGKTVLENTLERLLNVSAIEQIVVAISAEDHQFKALAIATHPKIKTVIGGEERYHSVLNGLLYLSNRGHDQDWALVHDVARPCVRSVDIHKLVHEVTQFDAVGGLLANPVRDTMKRSDHTNQIIETVDRDNLWHALTPQLFRLSVLRGAIEQALEHGVNVTDEASAMERLGHQPLLVEGHPDNIKITHPQDLPLAALFIQQQEGH